MTSEERAWDRVSILEKRISTLEKESVELKEKLKQAKGIIKDLIPPASDSIYNHLPRIESEINLIHTAEKFLKKGE